ncbi:hypothetical protein C8R44DRAFT_890912 [Mycena epipterygia]|nr:hypothetical protein C8R44DRAFT_890912 [Mycena epipterygia]
MNEALLPQFTRASEDVYEALYETLWPTEPTSTKPGDSPEPEPDKLHEYIQSCAADDLSLWMDAESDLNDMDLNVDEDESARSSPEVRYIDLGKHPIFAVHALSDTARSPTFVVRQEYLELMAHAMKCEVYYFSAAGVQQATTNMNMTATSAAVNHSWVLIGVDLGPNSTWLPELWVVPCAGMVWTSSPQPSRMHHFTKQLQASVWYMKPRSSQEIVAVTTRNRKDRKDMPTDTDIDDAINVALADNLFKLVDQRGKASHKLFLIQPRKVFDADGRPSLERTNCSFDFLSNLIANRTAELAEEHADKVQRQLAKAFNNPATRSAAGKLVECMLHRAFIHRRMHVPTDLGGGQVAGALELIGKAEGFVFGPHMPTQRECRPLYLRLQSPNFAAVDAILVTKTALGLIQSSLAEAHSKVVKTLLRILARLETNKIAVDPLQLVYCLVGTDAGRVKSLVHEASEARAAEDAADTLAK